MCLKTGCHNAEHSIGKPTKGDGGYSFLREMHPETISAKLPQFKTSIPKHLDHYFKV